MGPQLKRRHSKRGQERGQFKRINNNMLKTLQSDGTGNSMDSRLNRKNKRPNIFDNNTTKSSAAASEKENKQRKKQKRLEKLNRQCAKGNRNACLKLMPKSNRPNIELVKSLNRRSSKNHQLLRKNAKKLNKKQR